MQPARTASGSDTRLGVALFVKTKWTRRHKNRAASCRKRVRRFWRRAVWRILCFCVALVVENGIDGYSLINAACGIRATRARFCLRLRLSFGRRVALVGKSLNQRVASFACSVRRTSPPTACGSYTRATVGSDSFGLARKREPPVRLRTAALFAVGPIV